LMTLHPAASAFEIVAMFPGTLQPDPATTGAVFVTMMLEGMARIAARVMDITTEKSLRKILFGRAQEAEVISATFFYEIGAAAPNLATSHSILRVFGRGVPYFGVVGDCSMSSSVVFDSERRLPPLFDSLLGAFLLAVRESIVAFILSIVTTFRPRAAVSERDAIGRVPAAF